LIMVNPLKHHDMGIAQAAPLSPRTNPTKAFAIASEVERSHLGSLEETINSLSAAKILQNLALRLGGLRVSP
jgi:hypothetical protein